MGDVCDRRPMARWIDPGRVRLRRATRRDLPAIATRLGVEVDRRFGRRLVADLGVDVYVAVDHEREGGVVGVVAVGYRRSFAAGRFVAVIDPLEAERVELAEALLAFAEERARRRGCREVTVAASSGAAAEQALRARGYGAHPVRVRVLEDRR